jgi:hypothetical protein
MQKTTAMAAFATPELRHMFDEWMATLEAEALEKLAQSGATDVGALAKALGISDEGAAYLILHLTKRGRVNLRVEAASATRGGG